MKEPIDWLNVFGVILTAFNFIGFLYILNDNFKKQERIKYLESKLKNN